MGKLARQTSFVGRRGIQEHAVLPGTPSYYSIDKAKALSGGRHGTLHVFKDNDQLSSAWRSKDMVSSHP